MQQDTRLPHPTLALGHVPPPVRSPTPRWRPCHDHDRHPGSGDQGLLAAYLSATSPALLNQTYANLLLMQQSLANSEIDSTLAVKIEAYQAR